MDIFGNGVDMTFEDLICPSCGAKAKKVETKFGIRNYCCDLWSWGYLEPLVDKNTHEMRKLAHSCFDRLWKEEGYSRGRAYELLAFELGISKKDCHIKLFDAETAAKVPIVSLKILERYKDETPIYTKT